VHAQDMHLRAAAFLKFGEVSSRLKSALSFSRYTYLLRRFV